MILQIEVQAMIVFKAPYLMRFEIIDQLLKLIDILIEFKCYLGSLAMFLILYQMIIEN